MEACVYRIIVVAKHLSRQ